MSQNGFLANERRLVIVSNRGPAGHGPDHAGRVRQDGGAGGVATALGCAIEQVPVTWVVGAGGTAPGGRVDLGYGRALQVVSPPADAYRLSYGTFCNPILWFLQHGMWDQLARAAPGAEASAAWTAGYLPVNRAFADAAIAELERTGARRVSVHDYHLYAAPRMIRDRVPDAVLQHFVHIPWPAPDAWDHLPRWLVGSICDGLLACDSVAFQTQESADNFLETCGAFLRGALVSRPSSAVEYAGRRTRVWANPVSVEPAELRARLAAPEAQPYYAKLAAEAGERTIVRVDRLDPAKNIVAGFQAFGRLLEDHLEWRGRVRFLAFLVPTRTGVPEYQEYARETFGEAASINERYGDAGWQPIGIFHEHNRLQALAALTMYDVLLVNSLADGMNLVAKEGVTVNARDGALVLSTRAGAFDELRSGALPIEPEDIGRTALALQTALTLSPLERRIRAQRMRNAVAEHSLGDWFEALLDDFARSEARRGRAASTAGAL
jgi:trehalose 6-phosphate synthase